MTDFSKAIRVRARIVPWAEVSGCFTNVHKMVRMAGGEVVFGWIKTALMSPKLPVIQTWTHHAIWKMPDGELRDITPQIDPSGHFAALTPETVFVPDPEATLLDLGGGLYRGRHNEFQALVNSGAVRAAIKALKEADECHVRGDRAGEIYWCREVSSKLPVEVDPYPEGFQLLMPFRIDP